MRGFRLAVVLNGISLSAHEMRTAARPADAISVIERRRLAPGSGYRVKCEIESTCVQRR
jgi:hypothetical protein